MFGASRVQEKTVAELVEEKNAAKKEINKKKEAEKVLSAEPTRVIRLEAFGQAAEEILGCRALRFPIWEPGSQFWEPGSQNPIFGSQTARKTSKNFEKLRTLLKGTSNRSARLF